MPLWCDSHAHNNTRHDPLQVLAALIYRPKHATLASAVGSHISMLIKKPVERSYRMLLKDRVMILMMTGMAIAIYWVWILLLLFA